MSIKAIDEIVKNADYLEKGYFTSAFSWLIPKKHISKGVCLLRVEDAAHLKSLINFNEEIRTALLFEMLRVENYLNTVIFNTFKKKTFKEVIEKDILFGSHEMKSQLTNIVKHIPKYEEKEFDFLFEQFTFGKKQEIISTFSDLTISKIFLNGSQFTKREFLKTIRLVVELRNKVAHQSFVTYPEFVESVNVQPNSKWNGSALDYFFDRIDQINGIFGRKGFKSRIKRIAKKYQKFLLIEKLC